jgi:hypothetical protein
MCRDLAKMLRASSSSTQDILTMEAVIEVEAEQLQLCLPGDVEKAVCCLNLAVSLHTHFSQTGDSTQLDKAIELYSEARALQPL